MSLYKNTVTPLIRTGLALFGSLLLTSALAGPPKQKHPVSAAGNLVAAGKRVFDANGCSNCHAIGGKGGKGGPDLSAEGTKRSRPWLAAQVVNPKAHTSSSTMPAFGNKIKGKDLTAVSIYLASLKR